MQYREINAFVEFLRSAIYKIIDINFIILTSFGYFTVLCNESLHNLLSAKEENVRNMKMKRQERRVRRTTYKL